MNVTIANQMTASGSGHWVHNLDPVALQIGFFQLRWYSLAYLAGIVIGWLYMLRLLRAPGAPMARRHADDMVFYGTLGIIVGGRLGYVLFYRPAYYLQNPIEIPQMWDGGMSFHGGLIGTVVGMLYLARSNGLNFLRICDYVACVVPFGLMFGRLANFVNGELYGHPTDVAWAVRFPEYIEGQGVVAGAPRHPSQLYEAGLEGVVLFLILFALFWWTRARYRPGLLAGVFTLGYGLSRFFVEYFRVPDRGLDWLPQQTGLSMGQWLCVPMILLGLYLIVTARRREAVAAYAEPAPPPVGAPQTEPA